ncbi:hypothetical protein LINPERHAP1_LOCUS12928 [Linum perenne]
MYDIISEFLKFLIDLLPNKQADSSLLDPNSQST